MATSMTMAEAIEAKEHDLGATEWFWVVGANDPRSGDRVLTVAGLGADQSTEEMDPFVLLTLLPRLIPELIQISGTAATVPVMIEKTGFSYSFAPGVEVRLRGSLLDARMTPEGHLAYRLTLALETKAYEAPAILAEVEYLSGNP